MQATVLFQFNGADTVAFPTLQENTGMCTGGGSVATARRVRPYGAPRFLAPLPQRRRT